MQSPPSGFVSGPIVVVVLQSQVVVEPGSSVVVVAGSDVVVVGVQSTVIGLSPLAQFVYVHSPSSVPQ